MSATGPRVFISSTYFDLAEVRATLSEFISGIGYQPILFEQPSSFAVNPDRSTEDNCIHNIHNHADIFILIVGKRSGAVSSKNSVRSVTNTEYLHARAKGIPVFVFIDAEVITWHSIWAQNRTIRFPGLDSDSLLEFVDQIATSTTWRFQFKSGADIVTVLRHQFAALAKDCLDLRMKMNSNPLLSGFPDISAEARRIIIERPKHWEYLLYSDVLESRYRQLQPRRRDTALALHISELSEVVPMLDFPQWMVSKLSQLSKLANGLMALMSSESMARAFGPVGSPGDPQEIVYIADRLMSQYEQFMIWKQSIDCAVTDERLDRLKSLTAQYSVTSLEDVENFVFKVAESMRNLSNNPPAEGETRTIEICLTLRTFGDLQSKIDAEMARLRPIMASAINQAD